MKSLGWLCEMNRDDGRGQGWRALQTLGINRESGFHKGASGEYQGGRGSNVPEAKGARNTPEITTNVPGNSGKRVTGKRLH